MQFADDDVTPLRAQSVLGSQIWGCLTDHTS